MWANASASRINGTPEPGRPGDLRDAGDRATAARPYRPPSDIFGEHTGRGTPSEGDLPQASLAEGGTSALDAELCRRHARRRGVSRTVKPSQIALSDSVGIAVERCLG